jgi:hypothetical protein
MAGKSESSEKRVDAQSQGIMNHEEATSETFDEANLALPGEASYPS